MIPTYVFGWPTGNETGDYLSLDLGTSRSIQVIDPYLIIVRRDESPSLPCHITRRRQIRNNTIQVPVVRGPETR
jgi:Hexokinase